MERVIGGDEVRNIDQRCRERELTGLIGWGCVHAFGCPRGKWCQYLHYMRCGMEKEISCRGTMTRKWYARMLVFQVGVA